MIYIIMMFWLCVLKGTREEDDVEGLDTERR